MDFEIGFFPKSYIQKQTVILDLIIFLEAYFHYWKTIIFLDF